MCKLISLLMTRQQENVNMQVIVKPPDMVESQTAYSLEFQIVLYQLPGLLTSVLLIQIEIATFVTRPL